MFFGTMGPSGGIEWPPTPPDWWASVFRWLLYLKKKKNREAWVSAWDSCQRYGSRDECSLLLTGFDQLPFPGVCLTSLGLHLSELSLYLAVLLRVADHRGAGPDLALSHGRTVARLLSGTSARLALSRLPHISPLEFSLGD